ncbi:unnamed protein product [Cunninghamella echinulata]
MLKVYLVLFLAMIASVSAWTCLCVHPSTGENSFDATEHVCHLFYGGKINGAGSCWNVTPKKKSPEPDFEHFCKKQSKSLKGFCY